MSIILKGIDPKTDYGLCILTIRGELITANGKHIQAIQIPKNHGRLIDGDELLKRIEESPTFASKYKETAKLFIRVYTEQGTILEAEE